MKRIADILIRYALVLAVVMLPLQASALNVAAMPMQMPQFEQSVDADACMNCCAGSDCVMPHCSPSHCSAQLSGITSTVQGFAFPPMHNERLSFHSAFASLFACSIFRPPRV